MKENETESKLTNTSGIYICVMFFGVMPSVIYLVEIKTPIICVLCLVEIEYELKMENIDHVELLQKELATSKESTCIIIIISHSLTTLPCRK